VDGRRVSMNDRGLQDQIAAAEAYEALHVPALFQEWTDPVLDAAGLTTGQHVLDVACGTGVLARAASERVGPTGSTSGVDPNAGMLAVAGKLDSTVEWRPGVAEALPFPDATFDAVVSQFGMMFFADRPAALREMSRVLVPGGRLVVAVWDALENSPAYSLEVSLLDCVAGRPAADALRAPFALGDPQELTALCEAAGLSAPKVITRMGTARFPSIRMMVEADLRGWLPVMGVTVSEPQIEQILREAESELAHLVEEGGDVVFDSPAHLVVVNNPGLA
jgi:SAM-dependent methyltransferase